MIEDERKRGIGPWVPESAGGGALVAMFGGLRRATVEQVYARVSFPAGTDAIQVLLVASFVDGFSPRSSPS